MGFAIYEIEELQKQSGFACLYCLVVASKYINKVTKDKGIRQSLHIYETELSRKNGLQYWRREFQFTETVFFTFEIPIDLFLEKAQKHI